MRAKRFFGSIAIACVAALLSSAQAWADRDPPPSADDMRRFAYDAIAPQPDVNLPNGNDAPALAVVPDTDLPRRPENMLDAEIDKLMGLAPGLPGTDGIVLIGERRVEPGSE